jgi:hypothetical protein
MDSYLQWCILQLGGNADRPLILSHQSLSAPIFTSPGFSTARNICYSTHHLSLPGAFGMFGLAMGVSRLSATLPGPVYALLSGLNAATVGIIALAGVQLARKAISGPLTRLLVVGTGCAGICYNALWYFPLILIIDGTITLSWSLWCSSTVRRKIIERRRHRLTRSAVTARGSEESAEESGPRASVLPEQVEMGNEALSHRSVRLEALTADSPEHSHSTTTNPIESSSAEHRDTDVRASPSFPNLQVMSIKGSLALAVAFFGERIRT